MQFLKGYKLHMGGFACLFLALGGVLQSASDEVPIDWNRAAADVTTAVCILGAAFKTKDNSQQ